MAFIVGELCGCAVEGMGREGGLRAYGCFAWEQGEGGAMMMNDGEEKRTRQGRLGNPAKAKSFSSCGVGQRWCSQEGESFKHCLECDEACPCLPSNLEKQG